MLFDFFSIMYIQKMVGYAFQTQNEKKIRYVVDIIYKTDLFNIFANKGRQT